MSDIGQVEADPVFPAFSPGSPLFSGYIASLRYLLRGILVVTLHLK